MTTMRAAFAGAIVMAFVAMAACAHVDPGGRRAVWQPRGAIVGMDRDTLRVRHKSSQIVEVGIDGETAFVKGTRPVRVI